MTLSNVRLRHATLVGVQLHIKNYLDCLERGYFGEITPEEDNLISSIKNTLKVIDDLNWRYYFKESELVE